MIKKLQIIILFFSLIGCCECFSQKTLEVLFTRFGKLKKFEIYTGDFLEYKLKGQHSYHRSKVTNMKDSFIVFSNDTIITLKQLKAIRLHKNKSLTKTFARAFIIFGAGFFFLNTTNNLINERTPVVDSKAAVIGASLVAAGLLLRQLDIKRLRLNGHKQLRIVDLSFENLSEKPPADK